MTVRTFTKHVQSHGNAQIHDITRDLLACVHEAEVHSGVF